MAYRLKYSDYSTTASGPPDPVAWVGPPGPAGPPGPMPPGGPFLPLSGGTVTGNLDADTGLFAGVANPAMRDGSHYTWVGSGHGMSYYDLWSTAAFYPQPGYQNSIAVAAAVRSSDTPLSPSAAAIAFAAYAVSDNSGTNTGPSWGYYGSNRRLPFSNTSFCMELSMGNLGASVDVNPWQPLGPGTDGATFGIWLTSGSESIAAGDTVHPAGAAFVVASNGSTWDKGIVFAQTGVTPQPVTGNMLDMQLPTKGEVQWIYSTAGLRSAFIRSDATAGSGVGILFDNTSFKVVDAASAETVRFAVSQAGAISVGSATGPTIRAGTGVATGTQPSGSLWLRTDGSAGARLYVSAGAGTWTAVATV